MQYARAVRRPSRHLRLLGSWLAEYTHTTATGLLWALPSVGNWEKLTEMWSSSRDEYIAQITEHAEAALFVLTRKDSFIAAQRRIIGQRW